LTGESKKFFGETKDLQLKYPVNVTDSLVMETLS
jgi:hypothetical protein